MYVRVKSFKALCGGRFYFTRYKNQFVPFPFFGIIWESDVDVTEVRISMPWLFFAISCRICMHEKKRERKKRMILYEGRTVSWKGHNVVIMHKVSSDRVKVCYESNPRVQRIVKVEDLQPKKTGWRGV